MQQDEWLLTAPAVAPVVENIQTKKIFKALEF